MAAAAGDDSLLTILTCSVCQQVYHEPVTLECGHNFCKACIEGRWGAGVFRTCPTCHKAHLARQFPVNRVLASLVQRQREAPQAAERDTGRRNTQCDKHQENIRLYCCDDGEVCCVVCRDAVRHFAHYFLTLPDATSKYKSQLKDITELIESEQEVMQSLIKDQEKQLDQHRVNYLHLTHHITSEFEKIVTVLTGQEKALLEKLRVQEGIMRREMEKNLEKLKLECQRMETAIANNNTRVAQEDPITFLTDLKAYLDGCQKEQEQFLSLDNGVISGKLCRGTFKGPLQYAAWKRVRIAIEPVAACLLLDPKTAQPNLIISEDKTQARYRSRAQWLPNNPERFSHFPIALATTGFSAGRHYWEVEVGNKTGWCLGLVKECLDRKQTTNESVKDDYWAIGRSREMQYIILTVPPKGLPLISRPQKIGVYLDYEGGQISFYNAGDMSHLHTFTDTFNTKLLPYVNSSDDNTEPIKLFHPRI